MALFSRGVPRLLALAAATAALCALPPEFFARGPDLCLWRHLWHISSCPACGSTRALAAFFHGRFRDALAFNRNVIVTAPCLLGLLGWDTLVLLRKLLCCAKIRQRLRRITPAELRRQTSAPGGCNP